MISCWFKDVYHVFLISLWRTCYVIYFTIVDILLHNMAPWPLTSGSGVSVRTRDMRTGPCWPLWGTALRRFTQRPPWISPRLHGDSIPAAERWCHTRGEGTRPSSSVLWAQEDESLKGPALRNEHQANHTAAPKLWSRAHVRAGAMLLLWSPSLFFRP